MDSRARTDVYVLRRRHAEVTIWATEAAAGSSMFMIRVSDKEAFMELLLSILSCFSLVHIISHYYSAWKKYS